MTPQSLDPPAGTEPHRGTATTDWILVHPRGALDLATAGALDLDLRAAVGDAHPLRHLVLDLADVTFLDCSGLRPLLRAERRLTGRLWLVRPSPHVRRLLLLTALSSRFQLLDTMPQLLLVPQPRTAAVPSRDGTGLC